jgi:hypothetical protein
MDAMAAFGSLIITEGATMPIVVAQPPAPAEHLAVQPRSPEEVQAVDTVFTHQNVASEQNPALPFLVVTACASALKGVVIDEAARYRQDEEEEEDANKPAKQKTPQAS